MRRYRLEICSTFFEVVAELIDAGEVGVPGEHDARGATDECVETPSTLADFLKDGVRGLEKEGVRFNGSKDVDAGDVGDLFSAIFCAVVGVRGIAEPGTALEHANPRRGEEAHL